MTAFSRISRTSISRRTDRSGLPDRTAGGRMPRKPKPQPEPDETPYAWEWNSGEQIQFNSGEVITYG